MKKRRFQKSQTVLYGAYLVTMLILVVAMASMRNAQIKHIDEVYGQILSPFGYGAYNPRLSIHGVRGKFIYMPYDPARDFSVIRVIVDYGIPGTDDYFVTEYSLTFSNCNDENIYDIIDSLPNAYDIRACKNDIDDVIANNKKINDYIHIDSPENTSIKISGDNIEHGDETKYEYTLYVTFSYGNRH